MKRIGNARRGATKRSGGGVHRTTEGLRDGCSSEMNPDFWNERYAEELFAYGEAPNDFLASVAGRLPPERTLEIGCGQGRNAVFLAQRGMLVTAVDSAGVGLDRGRELAARRHVDVEWILHDLATFDPGHGCWEVIVAIFVHLPADLRRVVHARLVEALAPGGFLVLEAYTPDQLARGTGGPPVASMLMSLDDLRDEFVGLDFVHAEELIRPVTEGAYHTGDAAVVQIVARKPAATPR